MALARETTSSREDVDLIERCKLGQPAAYGELVRKYQDRVFNVCWRMCGNRADAEDLAQEAFLKALKSIDRFDGRSAFYTWLFRIAVNVVISEQRKKSRRRTVSLDAAGRHRDGEPAGSWAAQRLVSSEDDPDRGLLREEQRELVAGALGALEEDHRCVVVLRDLESLDYDQIADILNLPIGTVKSRLHRARLALREKLSPLLEDVPGRKPDPA